MRERKTVGVLFCTPCRELLAQNLSHPIEPRFNGLRAAAEHSRDFLMGQIFVLEEQDAASPSR